MTRPFEIRLRKATSTNEIAKKIHVRESVTIISANEQTKGRGRYKDRLWFSPPDSGVYISIILSDLKTLPIRALNYMTKISALSVYDSLSEKTNDLYIKEPNDIYSKKGKIGGVIADSRTKGEVIERIIMSAGINIVRPPEVPDNLAVCYLSDLIDIDRNEIDKTRQRFLKHAFFYFEQIKNKKYDYIDEKFSSYLIQ